MVYLETKADDFMFFAALLLTLIITSIILLNFIVAEASNSYNNVNMRLEEYKQYAMADMISEVEAITPVWVKLV